MFPTSEDGAANYLSIDACAPARLQPIDVESKIVFIRAAPFDQDAPRADSGIGETHIRSATSRLILSLNAHCGPNQWEPSQRY